MILRSAAAFSAIVSLAVASATRERPTGSGAADPASVGDAGLVASGPDPGLTATAPALVPQNGCGAKPDSLPPAAAPSPESSPAEVNRPLIFGG